jgi:hypothetical protein
VDLDELRNRFAYHKPPDDLTASAHDSVRKLTLSVAEFLLGVLPDCDERRRAIDALDDAMKHANAAIARHGIRRPAAEAPLPFAGTTDTRGGAA